MTDHRDHWLKSLKPGDEVSVYSAGRFRCIRKVARLTTAWVVDDREMRYRISDGRRVGDQSRDVEGLHPVGDEDRRDSLVERLRDHNEWVSMPLDKLARIVAILDEPDKEASND
jgi:hypothetical protein